MTVHGLVYDMTVRAAREAAWEQVPSSSTSLPERWMNSI